LTASRVSALEVWARRLILGLLALSICVLGWNDCVLIFNHQPAGMDFAPIWTAGRVAFQAPHQIYDFAEITRMQQWLLRGGWSTRPFVYPPSTLLIVAPFAALPFFWAYGLWTGLTAAFMAWAAGRLAPERRWVTMALALFATPCFIAMTTGQTTFLAAGLAVTAVVELEKRPRLAGVLLAIAALIKPTTLIFAPVALIAGGHWRALKWALIAGLVGVAASAAAFGPQAWFEWLAAVPRFQGLIDRSPSLLRGSITPSGEAVALGVHGLMLTVIRLLCVTIAGILTWRAFSSTRDPVARVAALLGGGLLAAPYAMHYDGGLLAPAVGAAAARGIDGPSWMPSLFGMVLLMGVAVPHMGAFAIVVLVPMLVWSAIGLPSPSAFLRREPSVLTS
jgi:hypothetical protein